MNIRSMLSFRYVGNSSRLGVTQKEQSADSVSPNTWDAWNHLQVYIDSVGLLVSSLGDDSFAAQLVSENHSMDELTPYYESLYGWIVELAKSLVSSSPVLEYLREQAHGCYVVDYKCFNQGYLGEKRKFIVTCKPTSHVLKTQIFSEQLSRISPLVEEIAQIMRLYNLNLHPALDLIIKRSIEYGVLRYKYFTEPFDYVPNYNTEAWKKAGKPKGSSKYSIRIKDMNKAMQVAAEEAKWFVAKRDKKDIEEVDGNSALLEGVGLSYTHASMTDYDAISSFKASRLYRYLMALNHHDNSLAEKIAREVYPISTDFYEIINGLSTEADEVLDHSGDITELCHSFPLSSQP